MEQQVPCHVDPHLPHPGYTQAGNWRLQHVEPLIRRRKGGSQAEESQQMVVVLGVMCELF
jgi:hypothetical protein